MINDNPIAPIKVFIIEDDWMCREALVSVIGKKNGLEVVGDTSDVHGGLKQALLINPDVVLMDICYRGENFGIEATAAIKTQLPDTRVIVFTGFPDEDNLLGAVSAGASGYLLKKEVQDPDTIIQAIYNRVVPQ